MRNSNSYDLESGQLIYEKSMAFEDFEKYYLNKAQKPHGSSQSVYGKAKNPCPLFRISSGTVKTTEIYTHVSR